MLMRFIMKLVMVSLVCLGEVLMTLTKEVSSGTSLPLVAESYILPWTCRITSTDGPPPREQGVVKLLV